MHKKTVGGDERRIEEEKCILHLVGLESPSRDYWGIVLHSKIIHVVSNELGLVFPRMGIHTPAIHQQQKRGVLQQSLARAKA